MFQSGVFLSILHCPNSFLQMCCRHQNGLMHIQLTIKFIDPNMKYLVCVLYSIECKLKSICKSLYSVLLLITNNMLSSQLQNQNALALGLDDSLLVLSSFGLWWESPRFSCRREPLGEHENHYRGATFKGPPGFCCAITGQLVHQGNLPTLHCNNTRHGVWIR